MMSWVWWWWLIFLLICWCLSGWRQAGPREAERMVLWAKGMLFYCFFSLSLSLSLSRPEPKLIVHVLLPALITLIQEHVAGTKPHYNIFFRPINEEIYVWIMNHDFLNCIINRIFCYCSCKVFWTVQICSVGMYSCYIYMCVCVCVCVCVYKRLLSLHNDTGYVNYCHLTDSNF